MVRTPPHRKQRYGQEHWEAILPLKKRARRAAQGQEGESTYAGDATMTERETSSPGFHVGGETVQTYNDTHYKKLRERWGLGDDFLATFDFTKNMKGGGGKGGDLMGFTTDKLY